MPLGRAKLTSARYLAASLLLCALALGLRLAALQALPLFVDEGTHLDWAQRFIARQPDYPFLMHGKLLTGLVLAQFQVLGPGALWLGRAAVALLALPGFAAAIALGTRLASRRVGLLAGLVYALWPFAVFHERQILADPLAATAGALALVCWLRFARTGRWRWWLPVPFWLAAAILFKLTGAVVLAPLGLAALLLPVAGRQRWRPVLWLALALVAAALLGASLVFALRPWLGAGGEDLAGQQVGFVGCPPLMCQGDLAEQIRVSRAVFAAGLQAAVVYLGWPSLFLAGAAPWLAHRAGRLRWPRAVTWLGWAAAALVLGLLAAAKAPLPPRYFAPAAVLLAVLAALGWAGATAWLRPRAPPGLPRALLSAGLAGVVLLPFAQLPVLIARPALAALPDLDQEQYFDGPYAGAGLHEAATAIRQREQSAAGPVRVIVNHYLLTTVAAYFDRTRLNPVTPLDVTWADVNHTLAAGGRVYVVDQVGAGTLGDDPPGGEVVGVYPRLRGEQWARLRVFQDAQPAALAELYALLFGQLDPFRADYAALAQYLGKQAPPLPVAAYPASQGPYLQTLLDPASGATLVETSGDGRPWSIPSTLAALEQGAAAHDRLGVVFFQETRLDPAREVETWLAQHLFRVGEQWFGPLRLVEYAGPPPEFAPLPVNARFGEVIRLEAVDVPAASMAPGGRLPLRLHWRAAAQPAAYYKVFVHLFDAAGIAAQYDGQPVGELRPAPTWRPGELILDQLALALPPALPPGRYQLRIGLYDAASLARLPVQLADGSQAEFFVGSAVLVQ
jgi:hypothetical protein